MNDNEKKKLSFDYRYVKHRFIEQADKYIQLTRSRYSIIKGANINDDVLNGLSFDKTADIVPYLANLKTNRPDIFKELVSQAKKIAPDLFSGEYKELENQLLVERIKFLALFKLYLTIMDRHYRINFSETYKNKIFELAKNGYFLFFYDEPIFDDVLTDDSSKNEEIVCDYFLKDNNKMLREEISHYMSKNATGNEVERLKLSDLNEAVVCMQQGCYDSCCRTLTALIEHDHNKSSNIGANSFRKIISSGVGRAEAITKQINSMNIRYFKKIWNFMDKFYKDFNKPYKHKIEGLLNRHELVHGDYENMTIPTKEWCLKLFLFYFSFKHISFMLQFIFDAIDELKKTP